MRCLAARDFDLPLTAQERNLRTKLAEVLRRILRAYSRRVADGDIDALSLMARLADELDDAIA